MLAMTIKTMAEMTAAGETPEVLFWVGCAGSFDQRDVAGSRYDGEYEYAGTFHQ